LHVAASSELFGAAQRNACPSAPLAANYGSSNDVTLQRYSEMVRRCGNVTASKNSTHDLIRIEQAGWPQGAARNIVWSCGLS
jgi:hypothetical protein